jgi:hypothetical protein
MSPEMVHKGEEINLEGIASVIKKISLDRLGIEHLPSMFKVLGSIASMGKISMPYTLQTNYIVYMNVNLHANHLGI